MNITPNIPSIFSQANQYFVHLQSEQKKRVALLTMTLTFCRAPSSPPWRSQLRSLRLHLPHLSCLKSRPPTRPSSSRLVPLAGQGPFRRFRQGRYRRRASTRTPRPLQTSAHQGREERRPGKKGAASHPLPPLLSRNLCPGPTRRRVEGPLRDPGPTWVGAQPGPPAETTGGLPPLQV